MRLILLHTVLLSVLLVLATQTAGAGIIPGPINIGAPYVIGPGFTCAMPFSQGSYIMNECNRDTLVHDFAGSLAVSFFTEPGAGTSPASSFSPTIVQTAEESAFFNRMYVFSDVLLG